MPRFNGTIEAASRGGAWVRVPPNVVKALAGGDSQIDKDVGDTVTVTVARDESKRAVTVPADLAAVLRSATLRKTFDALSYSHQREYVIWIDDAKRADTRARRIAQTVERLKG